MNPCALNDQLDAYLDGDLAPRAARRFEAHAEACPACADELALARRLQGALRALPEEPCPYDVFQGALDRIAREAKEGRTTAHTANRPALPSRARQAGGLPRWQVAGAAVALVLLVALALALLRPAAAPVPGERVASTDQPADQSPEAAPPADDPIPPAEGDSLVTPVPAPPARQPERAPETPRRRTAPSPAAAATAPRSDLAEAAPSRNRPSETVPEPTPEEVASAREGVHLAFSLFADANRQATEAVRANVGQGLAHVTDAFTILR